MDDARARRIDAEALHRGLKDFAVLAALDRIEVDADDLNAILIENALLGKLHGKIKTRLAAKVRKNGIGALLGDNLLKARFVQRLDIRGIRHDGIGHDCSGVGIHKNNLISASPESLTGLGSGIIKFTGLADNNRTRTDNQNFIHVSALHCW